MTVTAEQHRGLLSLVWGREDLVPAHVPPDGPLSLLL